MGHEYVGIVEEVGSDVRTVKPGQFVIGSFFASDNTCEICKVGYQTSCVHRVSMGTLGAQAEYLRVPLADGTLVATPDVPSNDLLPSTIDPGRVFDLTLPLDDVAEGYKAMDERRAIKTLLEP